MAETHRRDRLRGLLPVTVLTGFLGSGKTTLLNALLKQPQAANTAVIINEYGEVGVDQDLVQGLTETMTMTLLDNGCMCCALRGDLERALLDLFAARRSGEVGSFERVILETTGLADPAPIMQTLISDRMLMEQYRLDGIITLIDAAQGLAQIADAPEALKQVAIADRLIITKTDLAGGRAVDALMQRLDKINPSARRAVSVAGALDADFVLGVGLSRSQVQADALDRWLGNAQIPLVENHTHGIVTFTLWFDEPFDRAVFDRCVEVLTSLRGSDLLRVKGLINIVGESGPVVVQGVQHLFHPPLTLAAWPGNDRRSRLVFITRGISRATVNGLFKAIAEVNSA